VGANAPLVLFSGDALSPSALSLITRGAHMVTALNRLGTSASCLGNHDLDDGLDNFETRSKESEFPWLATNVSYVPSAKGGATSAASAASAATAAAGAGAAVHEYGSDSDSDDDAEEGAPLPQGMVRTLTLAPSRAGEAAPEDTGAEDATTMPGCKRFAILEHGSVRIGLLGLIEDSWLETLSHVNPKDLVYEDFADSARWWSRRLRTDHSCDLVVALTHMRLPNDLRLGSCAAELGVDLVLGGHDHFYSTQEVLAGSVPMDAPFSAETSSATEGAGPTAPGACLVAKSGTDFRALTEIDLDVLLSQGEEPGRVEAFRWARKDVTKEVEPDAGALALVEELSAAMAAAASTHLGSIHAPLDGRFSSVRREETNLGNLVTDLMRRMARSDCALLNGGSLRSDAVHAPGAFTMADLLKICPYPSEVPTVRVSGEALLEALESAVSKWPELEGRFPQVSGLHFAFDPRKEAGGRIEAASVTVGPPGREAPLDLTRRYTVATSDYMSLGNDGYASLSPVTDRGKELGNEWVVDLTRAPILPTLIRSHVEVVHGINTEQARFRDRTIERWRARLLRLAGKHQVGSVVCSGPRMHFRGGSDMGAESLKAELKRAKGAVAAADTATAPPADAPVATSHAATPSGGVGSATPGAPLSAAPRGDGWVDPDLKTVRRSAPRLTRQASAPERYGPRLVTSPVAAKAASPAKVGHRDEPLVLIAPRVEGRVINLAAGK